METAVAIAARDGLRPTVVTFDPSSRRAAGGQNALVITLERRLELLGELGIADVLVAPSDAAPDMLAPEAFAERVLRAIGAEAVVVGERFRFGLEGSGDAAVLERLGFRTTLVPAVERISSSAIRAAVEAGEIERAAGMLGRPPELEGEVVGGDARGRALGFPTANLAVAPHVVLPRRGIYAGAAAGHRAAVSVGVNPHYGGEELRVEAFLLDFAGDLYGRRLRIELWRRLRDERAFASEQELVEQIARDVDETRAAVRPA